MLISPLQIGSLLAALTLTLPVVSQETTDFDGLNSSIDAFLSSLDGDNVSDDLNSIIASANGIISDLTEFGLTTTPLEDFSQFAATATPGASLTTDGPYVSDIVESYSSFIATRTSGQQFSFDTTSFKHTKPPARTTTSFMTNIFTDQKTIFSTQQPSPSPPSSSNVANEPQAPLFSGLLGVMLMGFLGAL